jgi:hypothetical protein
MRAFISGWSCLDFFGGNPRSDKGCVKAKS